MLELCTSVLLGRWDLAGVDGGVASPPWLSGSSHSSSWTNCCNSPQPAASTIATKNVRYPEERTGRTAEWCLDNPFLIITVDAFQLQFRSLDYARSLSIVNYVQSSLRIVDEEIKNYIFKHIIYRINFLLCLPLAFCFSRVNFVRSCRIVTFESRCTDI